MPHFQNNDDHDEDSLTAVPVADERSLARRIALQALYEIDSARHPRELVIATQLQMHQPSERISRYARALVEGVTDHLALLDETIARYAPEWPVDQIAIIDRNILRLAMFEFAVDGRTPVGVAIDEAVELAKLFGAEGASSFVNGVLGSLADDAETLRRLNRRNNAGSTDSPPNA